MKERMTLPTELPLHPWRDRLEQLPEGKGNFYHYGPNYTADPIVIANGKLLLIQRGDSGKWALPGGFVDQGEDAITAGLRELGEEANLVLDDSNPQIIYEGPVDDPRATLNAWPETTALLWRLAGEAEIRAGDDAQATAWFALNELPSELHGSHAALIEQAITNYGTWKEQLAYFGDRCDITEPTGGHMGYERSIVTLPGSTRLFIKHHNPAHFSDSERERHSRDYLQKEFAVYQQLAAQTPHIAACHDLVADHTLVLQAYDQRDGWHWSAPNDQALQAKYIGDVLQALSEIEQVTFSDISDVRPAHESFERDGWGDYANKRSAIMALLATSDLPLANELGDELDGLYKQHQSRPVVAHTSFAHTDIRQSNLAWHPAEGVRIVDWSWAGPSAPGLDTTSFLIDLTKASIDTSDYMQHFVPHHARTLIGFWLGRATLPNHHGTNVREHQLASAVTAYSLLRQLQ